MIGRTEVSRGFALVIILIGLGILMFVFHWRRVSDLQWASESHWRHMLWAVMTYQNNTGHLPGSIDEVSAIASGSVSDPMGVYKGIPLPHYKVLHLSGPYPRPIIVMNPKLYSSGKTLIGFEDNHDEIASADYWNK